MLNGLDLFTGIGGLSLALLPWVRPIAYCENDRFAQGVILSRISDLSIPNAGIWDDVRTLKGTDLVIIPDIIYGGFPCQDLSVAGNGKGLEGERSRLFFEVVRLVRELRPTFVFLENVPAISIRGLDRVLMEFTALRYDCRWTIVSAEEVGALHKRERWFLLAHTNEQRGRVQPRGRIRENGKDTPITIDDGKKQLVANSLSIGRGVGRTESETQRRLPDFVESCGWDVEPDVCRAVNGLPHRVDRLKGLGNAVVPMQAREAFTRLMGL